CPSPEPKFIVGGPSGVITATVTDATSGPALSSVTSAPFDLSTIGERSVTLTGSDKAGNQTTVSCSYVVGYNILGPFSPIPNAQYNTGSTIPVKFALADGTGNRISDAQAQAIATSSRAKVTFDSTSPVNATYDAKTHTFQANIKTPKLQTLPSTQPIYIRIY